MQAILLTIGDEILIGQIVDTNSAWMATQLNLQGIKVREIVSLSDEHEAITEGVKSALDRADLVLITGGLGPTKDDITKKTLAEFFGVDLVFHEPTWERILSFFKKFGRSTTPAHKEQCFMPGNAEILTNKMGTAPGMWMERNGKVVVSMPGVPYEMKYLMTHEVLPKVKEFFPSKPIAHRTILTVGEGESRIAAMIEDFESQLPENIKLAYLPGLGIVRLRLSATGDNADELDRILDAKVAELNQLLPHLIFGYGNEQLAEVVGRMLIESGKKLGTAESCTGGYIAHKITAIPGASRYFQGSVVAYSNELKIKQLGVKQETLGKYGAVSENTVTEMVAGALETLGVGLAVAVSGIAGPGGGTPEKPVGTTWLAVGDGKRIKTRRFILGKDRLKNIEYTGNQALNMIRKFLLEG